MQKYKNINDRHEDTNLKASEKKEKNKNQRDLVSGSRRRSARHTIAAERISEASMSTQRPFLQSFTFAKKIVIENHIYPNANSLYSNEY